MSVHLQQTQWYIHRIHFLS